MEAHHCRQCSKTFQITLADTAFYGRITVPAPTLCPDCRQQRRLAWRNERKLYRDECDLCHKAIISLYHTGSPYQVYCQDCWWSDRWDPFSYGQWYNFSKPFFQQYRTLQLSVPRIALFNLHSTNSEYTNHSANNKNCYMGVAMGACEDCLYGHWLLDSRNCVDCLYTERSELAYECSYCQNAYLTFWSQYCQNTNDCLFCFECQDVQNCLGCVQLRHKQYYILNKPVSAEEFAVTKQRLLTDESARAEFIQQWEALKLKAPRRYTLQVNCEASTGNDLYNCSNATSSYNCRNLQNCKYMYDLGNVKDGMDCYEHGWLVDSELAYESHAGMAGYSFRFCNICADSRNLTYCDLCQQGCADLFGCIGLKKQNFCILNRQYSESDYRALCIKITRHMETTGEYGEYFPIALSPFAYNETAAQEYFPLTKESVAQLDSQWYEELDARTRLPSESNVSTCTNCTKLFRLVVAEQKFYEQTHVPRPKRCPDCRHLDRMRLRNPRQLWQRQCMCTQVDHGHAGRCATQFETTYSPERKELVYCESCYQKEVS